MSFLESAMAFSKDMMGGLVVGYEGENGVDFGSFQKSRR